MTGRYQGSTWRRPTLEEALAFLEVAKNEPGYDLAGACWTSTPYEEAESSGWLVDFKVRPSFDRCFGTEDLTHGHSCGCLRLVAEVSDIDPTRNDRLEDDGECWVDHHTGLAWRKQLIDGGGEGAEDDIWVGKWLEAYSIIERFNNGFASESFSPAMSKERQALGPLTRASIHAEWGEPDMVLAPDEEVSKDKRLLENIADEYWVYLSDSLDGGCIAYARYANRWVANPALRWPLSQMIKRHVDRSS